MDHLLPIYREEGICIVQNVWIFIILPITILSISLFYEFLIKKHGTFFTRMSILLFAVLLSHMLLDLVGGSTLYLFYPLSTTEYTLSSIFVVNSPPYLVLSDIETALILLAFLVLSLNLAETHLFRKYDMESLPPKDRDRGFEHGFWMKYLGTRIPLGRPRQCSPKQVIQCLLYGLFFLV